MGRAIQDFQAITEYRRVLLMGLSHECILNGLRAGYPAAFAFGNGRFCMNLVLAHGDRLV